MRIFLPIILSLPVLACSYQETGHPVNLNQTVSTVSEPDSTVIDSVALNINFEAIGNYNSIKQSIRRRMANGQHSGKDLENYLINEIIPHWYGTPWDFNGYTNIPNEGVIACGYFVSTTLLHAGIQINRYHLAQQAGLNEAKSLAIEDKNYETIYGIEQLKVALQERYEDGLYFVGLDSHVGYLLIRNG